MKLRFLLCFTASEMEHFHLTELKQWNIRTKYFQVDFALRINLKFLYVYFCCGMLTPGVRIFKQNKMPFSTKMMCCTL